MNDEKITKKKTPAYALVTAAALLLMFICGRVLPVPSGMSRGALQVLCIFAGALLLWMTVSTTWSALLTIAALALLPELGYASVFASSFGTWIFVYLLGVFMLTYALSRTAFLRRISLFFLSRRAAQKGPWSFLILYFAAAVLMGCIVTPEVVFMLFLAIAEELFAEVGIRGRNKCTTFIVLGLIFTASVTAMMTPIAHVFPLLLISFYTRDFGNTIGLGQYMLFSVPTGLLVLIVLFAATVLLLRPDVSPIAGITREKIEGMRRALPAPDHREIITVTAFFVCVIFWLLPDVLRPLWPEASTYLTGLGTAFPSLLAVSVLCMLRVEGEEVLSFHKAIREGVPWEAMVMVGAVTAVGAAMSNPSIGLTDYLTGILEPLVASMPPAVFVLTIALITVLMTNLTSNVVTGTLLYAIAMPMTLGAAASCSPEALVCILGAGISLAYATPAATSHVTIAYNTRWVRGGDIARYGFLAAVLSALVLAFAGTPLLDLIF